MQYGNLITDNLLETISICLNRTMQYGNLCMLSLLSCFRRTFKSYYVVWKPENENDENNIGRRFKSYYVVWKPSYACIWMNDQKSLNRTMQYGNSFFRSFFKKKRKFKSYYVVWKLERISLRDGLRRSLNRTMQYGNFFFRASTSSQLRRLNRTMQYGNL